MVIWLHNTIPIFLSNSIKYMHKIYRPQLTENESRERTEKKPFPYIIWLFFHVFTVIKLDKSLNKLNFELFDSQADDIEYLHSK